MKRLALIFLLIIVIPATWFAQSRRFFKMDNGQYITVWKRFGNTCYVIPGKYFGLTKPFNANFIETTNTNYLTIYTSEEISGAFMIQSWQKVEIHSFKKAPVFIDYVKDSARLKKILYKPNPKFFYKDLKQNAMILDIDIGEQYARTKNGVVQ